MTSQFGEDELIGDIFEQIGVRSACAFEVGAMDGEHFSNTKLFRDLGWNCLLIDILPKARGIIEADVSHTGVLDRVLDEHGFPEEIDLGVIDIDGQDFWVAAGLRRRPRVLMIEFDPRREEYYIPPRRHGKGDQRNLQQATLRPVLDLLDLMGYRVGPRTKCNQIGILK